MLRDFAGLQVWLLVGDLQYVMDATGATGATVGTGAATAHPEDAAVLETAAWLALQSDLQNVRAALPLPATSPVFLLPLLPRWTAPEQQKPQN